MIRRPAKGLVQTLDQGVSALVNLSLTLVAGHLGGLGALGELNLAVTVYVAMIGFHRAVILEGLLVSRDRNAAARGAVQIALGFSVILGVVVGVVGLVLGNRALQMLSFVVPGILLVDVVRYAAFCLRSPAVALIVDCTWLASTWMARWVPGVTVPNLVVWWGIGGAFAALVGTAMLSLWRWRQEDVRCMRSEMVGRAPQGFFDTVLLQLGWYVPLAVALDYMNPDVAGAYRAAITLMAPMGVVLTSWTTSTFLGLCERREPGFVVRRAALILGLSVTYAVTCVLFRDELMRLLFGRGVVVPVLVALLVAMQIPMQAPGSQFAAWFKHLRRAWVPVEARAFGTALVVPLLVVSIAKQQSILAVAALPAGMALFSGWLCVRYLHFKNAANE